MILAVAEFDIKPASGDDDSRKFTFGTGEARLCRLEGLSAIADRESVTVLNPAYRTITAGSLVQLEHVAELDVMQGHPGMKRLDKPRLVIISVINQRGKEHSGPLHMPVPIAAVAPPMRTAVEKCDAPPADPYAAKVYPPKK